MYPVASTTNVGEVQGQGSHELMPAEKVDPRTGADLELCRYDSVPSRSVMNALRNDVKRMEKTQTDSQPRGRRSYDSAKRSRQWWSWETPGTTQPRETRHSFYRYLRTYQKVDGPDQMKVITTDDCYVRAYVSIILSEPLPFFDGIVRPSHAR